MTKLLRFLIEMIPTAFAGFYMGLLLLLAFLGYQAIVVVGIIIGVAFILGVD